MIYTYPEIKIHSYHNEEKLHFWDLRDSVGSRVEGSRVEVLGFFDEKDHTCT